MLHQKLKDDLKEAMRSKDTFRMTVLRGLLSAFVNESVAKKRKPDEMLPDEDAMPVLSRAGKQRKDSIEQFTAGGRKELADQEAKELLLIQSYLPQMMSQSEIRPIAEAKKAELGITDPAKKGLLMSAIMRDLKGKADGADVKVVVDSLL